MYFFLTMKKFYIAILILFVARGAFAEKILNEGFEYGNHDGETPVGWTCDDASWLCGYQDKDHNRKPHTGSWYVYTDADESWMFMPLYMSHLLQYNFSYWAISDGNYSVEIWAGTDASAGSMAQLVFSDTVNSGFYEYFSTHIETINDNYDYVGIHAVANDAAYHLTIDDIIIEEIYQYDFYSSPASFDTVASAGSTVSFRCKMVSRGFETVQIYMTPHSEFFTNTHFFVDEVMTSSFPISYGETVMIKGETTLRPNIEPGTLCWIDVMFDIDCGCSSAMFTLWATVTSDGIEENHLEMAVYPNPSNGNVTIEGDGFITIFNAFGQEILTREIIGKETISLEKGVYFIKRKDSSTEKLIVE